MSGHIAILMAVRNGAGYLQEQLASIASQRHADWSLHVSDDRSEDGSMEIVKAFAAGRPGQVTLRTGPGRGGAQNFLALLDDATVPQDTATAWCDQDDVWLPDRLARAVAACATDAPVLYASRYRVLRGDGSEGAPSTRLQRPVTFGNALVQNPLPGHTMVANAPAARMLRKAVTAALAADVPFHDWWTCQILVGAGANVVFDETPGVLYRQHGGNQVGARGGPKASMERWRIIGDGRFATWLDRNAAALSATDLLTQENATLLERFIAWRQTGGRRASLASLGIWRQDRLGGLALTAGARLRLF
ncbi:MAG: glycosyltransferase [Jannaschia sp.]